MLGLMNLCWFNIFIACGSRTFIFAEVMALLSKPTNVFFGEEIINMKFAAAVSWIAIWTDIVPIMQPVVLSSLDDSLSVFLECWPKSLPPVRVGAKRLR